MTATWTLDVAPALRELPLEDAPTLLDEHGPVFVLGCPRSATTFLSRCLSGFSGVEEFVGVLAPPRMMHLLGRCSDRDITQQIMLSLRDTFWNAFWRRRYFRTERLTQWLRGNLQLRALLRRPTMEGALLCYKEPFLCFACEVFAEHFPHARFIHIIRDGRDNADSLERCYPDALSDPVLRSELLARNKVSEIGTWEVIDDMCVPWWIPAEYRHRFATLDRYERHVLLWREMTARARRLRTMIPLRYLELRFEDIVDDPVRAGRQVGEFIRRPVTRRVLRRLRRARGQSVAIGRRNQSASRIAAANKIAGSLLEELGYSQS